jgi:hypothetical protein
MLGMASVSSNANSTVLSIVYDAEQGTVGYLVKSGGAEFHFSAKAVDLSGIRSLEVSEDFDQFLQSISPRNPGVVKLVVSKTWSVIDRHKPVEPFDLG